MLNLPTWWRHVNQPIQRETPTAIETVGKTVKGDQEIWGSHCMVVSGIVCTHICIHIHEQMCIRAYVYTSCALLCVRTKKTLLWPWVFMFISMLSARMCCLLVLTRITCWPHQQPPVCWCMRPSEIRSSAWYPWHPGSLKMLNPNTPSPHNMAQACWMSRDRNSSHGRKFAKIASWIFLQKLCLRSWQHGLVLWNYRNATWYSRVIQFSQRGSQGFPGWWNAWKPHWKMRRVKNPDYKEGLYKATFQ